MPQTLLALGAILAFSFFALSQHRTRASTEAALVGGELEQVASDLARATLLDVTRHAFDEADIGRDDLRTAPGGLTAPADLGPDADETAPDRYDDLDDFHRLDTVQDGTWDGEPVRFTVRVTVRYVEPGAPDSGAGSATLAKEVTVTVEEETPLGARPPATCTLRQVVTPAWGHFHS
ncbi:MAG: hypothetical protein R3181_07660 [Rubricoccaceae bacterium]|nr:hypothetical protein [Rubricoccaceae bacterium]